MTFNRVEFQNGTSFKKLKAREQCLQIMTLNIFIKRKLEMEVEREKILLETRLTSTLVLSEIVKKKKRKKRWAIWIKDWLKRRKEQVAYNNIVSDCHHFHKANLIGTHLIFW